MKEVYYYTTEMIVGNLFIILVENGYNEAITWDQVIEFTKILTKEMEKNEIPFRNNYIWDEPIDECDLFICAFNKIFLRRTLIDLVYNLRLYERDDVLEILESEALENNTLKMMGIEKRSERIKLDIDGYINWLEEEIEKYALKKNYIKCVEITNEVNRIKDIGLKIKNKQLCIQKK